MLSMVAKTERFFHTHNDVFFKCKKMLQAVIGFKGTPELLLLLLWVLFLLMYLYVCISYDPVEAEKLETFLYYF